MLEVRNLSFTAGGEPVNILRDVSFSLPEGRILVITGPNGGGKSTLAKLLMGIEKPDKGQIFFQDQEITRMSVTERARMGIRYAFQAPPRFKGVTVRQLLELAANRTVTEEECCEWLAAVGLCAQEYLNREADASLSGGEMKRIEIATILAGHAKLCVYDEPEAGIDLWSFSMLVDTFQRFKKSGDNVARSMILISHQERIIELADDLMILAGGRITAFGPRDKILPQLQSGFNGTCPYHYTGRQTVCQ